MKKTIIQKVFPIDDGKLYLFYSEPRNKTYLKVKYFSNEYGSYYVETLQFEYEVKKHNGVVSLIGDYTHRQKEFIKELIKSYGGRNIYFYRSYSLNDTETILRIPSDEIELAICSA